ncbi:MAG: PadR family transcriptional regulator [Thermoleophilaceae bacterium]|jgi:DNA-binding PadR family transcriptional regulator|nr:PadR family transcriptional regulator [Thermoleophilaceae bacterium]
MPADPERARSAAREAVARTTDIVEARTAARTVAAPAPRTRSSDPFTAGLRRREVLPLLILHYIGETPSYGNQLIDRISGVTAGVVSVNPNTMYPLLRQLEERGLIEGRWEHPERRSRRYYSMTDAGREEYQRLVTEVRPFLESVARSIEEIVGEVYG